MAIPRRIIQTAKSRELAPLARAAAANLKLLHPDWEYLFFDDAEVERFVANEFPAHRRTFESFPRRIQRYDFFRYLAVLHYGGFYFDLDVFLSEPLADLLPSACVFPFEELTLNRFLRRDLGLDWEIGNYGFGAAPGHPFIAAIVEHCVRAQTDAAWARPLLNGIPAMFRDDFYVVNTTGPGLVTRTLAERPTCANSVTVLYSGDVCDERNWHRFGHYGVHLMEASWRNRRSLLHRRIALWWENRRRRQFLALSRTIGATRSHTALAA